MAEEASNNEIAAIVHAGLPGMVRRIYSLGKMQTFFWEKRELIQGFIADRLQGGDDSKKAKKSQIRQTAEKRQVVFLSVQKCLPDI